MTEFFAMGGYARFVWPAYGAAFVLLVGLLLLSLRHYRERQRQLDRVQRKR
jgi:heme exporter protein D